MSMYAVVEREGQQYKVKEGEVVFIDKISDEVDSDITFENVLLVSDGDSVTVGTPFINGALVTAKVLKHGKDNKIIVFKYKPKKGYKKKQGHRQLYTQVRIEKISV